MENHPSTRQMLAASDIKRLLQTTHTVCVYFNTSHCQYAIKKKCIPEGIQNLNKFRSQLFQLAVPQKPDLYAISA
jgi:hypothetical protein